MSKMICANCKEEAKIKFKFWGNRIECAACGYGMNFYQSKILTAVSIVFGLVIVAFMIVSKHYFENVFGISFWMSLVLRALLTIIIFAPMFHFLTCCIYIKMNKARWTIMQKAMMIISVTLCIAISAIAVHRFIVPFFAPNGFYMNQDIDDNNITADVAQADAPELRVLNLQTLHNAECAVITGNQDPGETMTDSSSQGMTVRPKYPLKDIEFDGADEIAFVIIDARRDRKSVV